MFGLYQIAPAAGYSFLQHSIKTNNTYYVDFLLKLGVPANPNDDIKKFYFEASLQDSLLHNAVTNGNLDIIKLLINNGADINACCCSCTAPLHLAILNKDEQITKLLLESGASTDLRYDLTLTPLQLANKFSTPKIAMLVSYYAIQNKEISIEKPQ
jgi:ankyrin repeat protein